MRNSRTALCALGVSVGVILCTAQVANAIPITADGCVNYIHYDLIRPGDTKFTGPRLTANGTKKVVTETDTYDVYEFSRAPDGTLINPPFFHTTCNKTIQYQTDIQFWQQQLAQNQHIINVLGTINFLRPLTEIANEIAANMLAELLFGDNSYADAFGVGLAIGEAGALSGTFGFLGSAFFASTAILTMFAKTMIEDAKRIIKDPPDPAYLQVVGYSNEKVTLELGGPVGADQYMSQTLNAVMHAAEAVQGERISLERFSAALLAGNDDAAALQIKAADKFEDDFPILAREAGNYLLGLPPLLAILGVPNAGSDTLPGVTLYGLISEFGGSLGGMAPADLPDLNGTGTDVPEPSTLILFGTGLLSLATLRLRKKGRREISGRL